MHTITLDGHTYSVDHIAARLVLLSAVESSLRSARYGGAPSMESSAFNEVLRDQQDGIHRITAGACSCGLVQLDVRTLGGHRDLATVDVAGTFVAADHDGWWAMACQACRVVSESGSADAAHRRVRDHLCAWDVRDA